MQDTPFAYAVYKGLQRPLVFLHFKGVCIYWGIGSIFLGLVVGMLFFSLLGFLWGLLSMILILGIGLGITLKKQKQGLYNKRRTRGAVMLPPTFHRSYGQGKNL
ncbi:hypothetical protein SAMN05421823_11567 [Catalinimonas alkaloidigena]|uniref:DUF4133 domain-containing protein n=1 Tax=Catalinimonas alkaloidigena TaxID=1075417 RepID=A0A1G9U2I8_9BACT|nr:hypothetical protein [Catalinimonas alkaloidigena]SDM54189.1 hypothetical protein SAMN05421823_11567 [Catalinimonas alkaloidigena]